LSQLRDGARGQQPESLCACSICPRGGRHGLIAFPVLGEIAKAVREINADYTRHSLAAREIARNFFEAEKVLRSLLERAGI
jgi:hypothetical protein